MSNNSVLWQGWSDGRMVGCADVGYISCHTMFPYQFLGAERWKKSTSQQNHIHNFVSVEYKNCNFGTFYLFNFFVLCLHRCSKWKIWKNWEVEWNGQVWRLYLTLSHVNKNEKCQIVEEFGHTRVSATYAWNASDHTIHWTQFDLRLNSH